MENRVNMSFAIVAQRSFALAELLRPMALGELKYTRRSGNCESHHYSLQQANPRGIYWFSAMWRVTVSVPPTYDRPKVTARDAPCG